MVAVCLDADYLRTATREQFEWDAAGACKEVEGAHAFQVDVGVEHVEDVLFGEIGGGTRLEGAWYVEATTFVDACDDTHFCGRLRRGWDKPFGRLRTVKICPTGG